MAISDRSRAERNREIFRAYQRGASTGRLASVYGLSAQRIAQIVADVAKRQGVQRRPPLPRGGKGGCVRRDWTVPEDLCEDYRRWKKSVEEIARILGKTRPATAWALKTQGVKRDKAHKPPTLESQIYAAFRKGKSMPEIEAHFGVSRSHVASAIGDARRKSRKPYYRYPKRQQP